MWQNVFGVKTAEEDLLAALGGDRVSVGMAEATVDPGRRRLAGWPV